MRNLLASHFARLRRDKVFWLCCAILFGLNALFMWMGIRHATLNPKMASFYSLDSLFFGQTPFLCLFCAAFSSLFFGVEYGNGTIRNKLIAGHNRTSVYLSAFLLSSAASTGMALAGALGGATGMFYFGGFQMGWRQAALYIGIILLSTIAVTAIYTALELNLSNRAVSVVIVFAAYFVILILGSYFYNALQEPELINTSIIISTEGGVQMGDLIPNPDYVSGVKRQVYQVLLLLNPLGQQIQIANAGLEHPLWSSLSSVALSVLATLGGLLIFRKKDIK